MVDEPNQEDKFNPLDDNLFIRPIDKERDLDNGSIRSKDFDLDFLAYSDNESSQNENNNIDLDYSQNYSNINGMSLGFDGNSAKSNKLLSSYNNFFNGYNQVLSQNKNEKNILMKEYSYKNFNFNP